ncbi:retropepsin-like aspartic protease [Lutibacter flavus]|uniref:Aspartyl protease n=1 Tax=Lutibacter flavus TaxID=691689 RepID=A0A238XCU6_9FLAO|nr:retropepsin-like aspartic protease [Lutibacter flavus]SNR56323.1 Aspartyl protease [Lutibacter flavus]
MNLNNILIRKGYSKIKLKKINTNHFEIKAKLNGVNGRFILDTGASNSCIDINLAEEFKLNVKDSETKAAGAGAIGMETKISSKNKIELKKWSYKNLNMVLLDLSHVNTALTEHDAKAVHGIIGADILEKGKAIIDYKNKCIYLKKLVFRY